MSETQLLGSHANSLGTGVGWGLTEKELNPEGWLSPEFLAGFSWSLSPPYRPFLTERGLGRCLPKCSVLRERPQST